LLSSRADSEEPRLSHRRTEVNVQVSQQVPTRKLFSFLVASADGYYEGPNQEFDWPLVDAEFNEFAV